MKASNEVKLNKDMSAELTIEFALKRDMSTIVANEFTLNRDMSAEMTTDFTLNRDMSAEMTIEFTLNRDMSAEMTTEFTLNRDMSVEMTTEFRLNRTTLFKMSTVFRLNMATSTKKRGPFTTSDGIKCLMEPSEITPNLPIKTEDIIMTLNNFRLIKISRLRFRITATMPKRLKINLFSGINLSIKNRKFENLNLNTKYPKFKTLKIKYLKFNLSSKAMFKSSTKKPKITPETRPLLRRRSPKGAGSPMMTTPLKRLNIKGPKTTIRICPLLSRPKRPKMTRTSLKSRRSATRLTIYSQIRIRLYSTRSSTSRPLNACWAFQARIRLPIAATSPTK